MTTMNEFSHSKQHSVFNNVSHKNNDDTQYSILNLNQDTKCSSDISPLQSYNTSVNDKFFDSIESESCKGKEKSELWNKSSKTSNFRFSNDENKEVKKGWKKDSNNNSTLSLHISAYENLNEIVASDSFLNGEGIKKNGQKQIFDASSTFVIQNPFEFPRQQNSNVTDPEMSHYSASQRLLNPNKASAPKMINSRFPISHDLLNMGVKKKFNIIEVLDRLFDGSEGIEIPAIYRGQSYWIQFETAAIVDKVKEYFRLIPSARQAVLYLIGTMIHEDLNCSFLEKERNFSALKYFKLHDAVEQIYAHILELLQTATNRADANDTLHWGINLCFDLIHFNVRRMKVAKPSMQAESFRKTDAGAKLLQFLQKVFVFMLQNYPDDAFFTLVVFSDIHRPAEERQFEWLMLFFLNQFSTSVISRFIVYGGNKIRRICNDNHDPVRAETIFNQLFSPLIPIMFFLQQSRSMETNDAIEKVLVTFMKGQLEDNFDVIFLLRVCCSCPVFFDEVLMHVAPIFLVTQQQIYKFGAIMKDPFNIFVRDKSLGFFECFTRAIFRFSPMKSVDHLEMLQIMAFNPAVLENASEFDTIQQKIVRDALKIVCYEILNNFIKFINDSKKASMNDLPKYKDLLTNDKMLSQLIQQCLEVNEFGEQRCKLLHCLCLISDISFVRRVFASFIYAAETPAQLLQFTAFAATVVLHYPSAMLEGIKDLVKRSNAYVSMFDDKSQKFQTFFNIMTLLRWAKDTANNSTIQTSMFGLRYDQFVNSISIAELVGLLIRFGISNLAIYLETLEKMNEESFKKFTIVMEFVKGINGAAPMEPGMSYTISRFLSTVYVHCLRLVDVNDKPNYGTASIFKFNDMIKHILTEKWKFSKNCFVSTLVKEVLICSKEVFGIGIDLTGVRDYYSDGSIESCLLPNGKDEASLLQTYRDTTVRNERARELVHSGIFNKKMKTSHTPSQMSSERARAHFFFITLKWLLTTPPESPNSTEIVYDALALREVANSFSDIICSDKHLSNYYHMGDWYEEKIFLSDHVEITRKLDAIPICYDLMAIFAEAPYPAFFCIAPLITAQLAFIVNRCELTLYKYDPIQSGMLDKIEKILTLIAKADILTNIMPLIFEVIRRSTMHECSSILIELWRILTLIRPSDERSLNGLMSELNLRLHESPRGIVPMPECPSLQLLKLMNLIVQRNAEKMSDLGFKIISLFPPEPEGDPWEPGPLFPVIALNDSLKRL